MDLHPGSFYLYPERAPPDVRDQLAGTKTVLLILNQPISADKRHLFNLIWARCKNYNKLIYIFAIIPGRWTLLYNCYSALSVATLKVSADGGTNCLYQFGNTHGCLEK